MRRVLIGCVVIGLLAACGPVATGTVELPPMTGVAVTFTKSPALTMTVAPTVEPSSNATHVTMDFIALLCSAKWANGTKYLTACPAAGADLSGGYAIKADPQVEHFPGYTPLLLTVPAWDGNNSLFLRYPAYMVQAGDRFQSSVVCQLTEAKCDVQFALEYYDAGGTYHPLFEWNQVKGAAPIDINEDLSALANQSVEFVLVMRLFHRLDNANEDHGLWIDPHIYRP
ncbi:MAG: hypothetical protein U0Z26_18550 [Anaerolineales bacterium]